MSHVHREPTRRGLLKAGGCAGLLAATSPASADTPYIDPAVKSRLGDSQGRFTMPAHFGPAFTGPLKDTIYHDVTSIRIEYRTDADRLRRFVPEPFELRKDGIVTVAYSMNRHIDWLAGASYNIVAVSTPAVFQGRSDVVLGDYALVLWEDLTEPILGGREQGLPKIYGEIEDHQIYGGAWSTRLTHSGFKIMELNAADLEPSDTRTTDVSKRAWLGWKYVADEARDTVLLSYGTVFPYSITAQESFKADGSIQWFPSQWRENPTQSHVINALHSLPVASIENCIVWRGQMVLHLPQVRRIS